MAEQRKHSETPRTPHDPQRRPPRIPQALLRVILRRKGQEDYLGELAELYAQKTRDGGSRRARAWYWRQFWGFALRWRSIRRSVPPHGVLSSRSVFLDSTIQDLRFGLRTLGRRPLFTVVAVATLGLGIGATTTIYSVVDAVLLRALPFPEADRLVSIWTTRLNSRGERVPSSLYFPEYRNLLVNAATLENVALYFYAGGSLQGRGDPMNLFVGEGTATLCDVVGIHPQLGRWFRPEEVGPEKTYVAVLGDALWRERFDADPDVIGTTILVEHDPYEVIGVMPPEFRLRLELFQDTQGLLSPQDDGERPIWLPTGHNYGSTWYWDTTGWTFEAIARLKPGVGLEAAQAEVEALVRGDRSPEELQLYMARRDRLEIAGLPAQILLLAVPSALLLLIACGNVATLLMGESEGRRGEMATRAAIGAGKGRIVRQLLTESVILGLAGSAVGMALAYGAVQGLVAFAPVTSAMASVRVSLSALAFSSIVGIAAGIGFGLLPALTQGRDPGTDLQSRGSRTTRGGRRRVSLVIGLEVGLTLILLICGGLFSQTLLNLTAQEMGFDPERLVAFPAAIDIGLPADERAVAYGDMLRRMEEVPGVEAATGSWAMPLLMGLWSDGMATEDLDVTEGSQLPQVSHDVVMPDYHQVMGIPLLAGRHFTTADGPGAPPVVIVSESLAEDLWPGESAVGKRVLFERRPEWHTVVGVVRDVRHGGLDSEPRSPVYRPYLQNPGLNGIRLTLTARTSVDPREIIPEIEAAARSAFPPVVLREGSVMSSVVSETATDQRYRALLVVSFGLAAVILAAVGIFGVVARGVAQRARELAIRQAMGAESRDLRALVLGGTLTAGAAGMTAGLLLAAGAGGLLEGYLFGVRAHDPWVFGTAILAVLLACGLAAYLPTSRLLLLQPATVLKEE